MYKKVLIALSAVLVLLLISVPFPGVKYTLASETSGNLTAGMETGITGVVKSAPIASPAAGTYTSDQIVTLTASGSIAIYYTTNGTTPACGTGTLYTSPIPVTSTTTIKGIACYGDDSPGPVASYTYTITAAAAGGGGGGGAPPAGTTNVRGMVTTTGRFMETVTCASEDGLCTLTIPRNTVGLTEDLRLLTKISMLIMDDPPPPPADANVIGLAYNFEPSGATFDPPVTLEYTYDPANIPEGVAEKDLVVAWYNAETGEWVELDCVVDTENHTITASVPHFTTFAIIGKSKPAAFTLSSLVVSPAEVAPGEKVNISMSLANTGGREGSYTVVLKINDLKEAEKTVTIAAGSSQTASFSVAKEEAGSYNVAVDGLSGSFTVVAPPVPAPPAEEPTPAPPAEEPTPAPPAEEPTPAPPAEEPAPAPVPSVTPINWPLIGGIIGGVIVVGLLVFFLIRRRSQLTRQ